jgi:23S rRNA (uracil1939-C5)-methyltransferase
LENTKGDRAEDLVEVVVERILPGGLGLAHADGRTIFVALSAPGDRLRVKIERVKGKVVFASVIEILEPSSVRIEPPCPYFGRCGGCDFQQMNYAAQLDAKVEIIRDCLRRIGGIEDVPQFQITPAPNQWHYRSRAQWQYDAARKWIGYFESGSRRVCDVAECAVLVPELQNILSSLREQMERGTLPDDTRDFRALAGDEDVSVSLSVRSPTVWEGQPREVHRSIQGETYVLNAASFFQTNVDLLPQLIEAALGDSTGETAIELYCGVGLLTLPLARRFKHVVGVESDTTAGDFARVNLAKAGLANAVIANEDVARWLEENLECGGRVPTSRERRRFGSSESDELVSGSVEHADAVNEDSIQSAVDAGALQKGASSQRAVDFLLLDPPRTGAESRVINGILSIKPERICYVSCDPATLARDLKKLIAGGYSLQSIVAFDMFPHTHHVETVVKLISTSA